MIEENSKTVRVIRDGKKPTELHKNFLVVGDIVMIDHGINVPVDGICLESVGVKIDESAMTGESDHFPKVSYDECLRLRAEYLEETKNVPVNPKENRAHEVPSCMILSGTQVQTGEGKFVTIVVGEMTCEGQIMASVEQNEGEMTALQRKLDIIAVDIGKLGMACALLLFHFLVLREIILEGLIRSNFDLFGGEMSADDGKKCQYKDPVTFQIGTVK